ncbi:hypothetical protein MPNT_20154 [Candidatus Methylacidithermus pantelleriae]|uniref:Uncharacterized protein n=1 Tax=Candidatus Methylacidithermus pantelleriae TaxID=2744239 RepID=A0A8J2FS54_9BACT|nr:hypothetical protein MPNT_20154 [Candidatus Methylacidithermus pantelleriae]
MVAHPGADVFDGLEDPQRFTGEPTQRNQSQWPVSIRFWIGACTPQRKEPRHWPLAPPHAPFSSRSATIL